MSDRREVSEGVNILIFEGGGARGLSSLLILDETMNRLQHALSLPQPPMVREYFDIVAGTGTGAVIACMVGRLGIPVKQAIEHYLKLVEVFSDKKFIGTTTYKTTKLRDILKGIVKNVTGDENTRMIGISEEKYNCRTMVFAMSKHNMNASIPRIFCSYQGTPNQMPDCAIWEALSASMAHPEMFKSINIGEEHMRESFVEGGFGCTNPTAHVLLEAKALFPDRHLSTVICIGAGHPQTIHIPESNSLLRMMPAKVLTATKQLATDGERVAQEMAVRFHATTDVYFRFSVDQGMQNIETSNWERLNEVSAHTRAYMQTSGVNGSMRRAVTAIAEKKEVVKMELIDGHIQPPVSEKPAEVMACPAPTPVFTGRQGQIDQIVACISLGDEQRCVFVLYGLGGAGKTQLALKTVENTRDMWTEVLFVDATSRETANGTLESFAKARNIGSSYRDTIRWLGSRRARWLMVIDNADDPSVQISDFIPGGNHGSILITTRISGLAVLARGPKSNVKVASMESWEGMELLLRSTGLEGIALEQEEHDAATELLESFGYLALAIVQAGAYIRCSECTIYQYRDMFSKHRQLTLERYRELLVKVDEYQKSVYTTWHMSYKLLGPNAQRLLHLMAFMHHAGISEDIFRRAAKGLRRYTPAVPESDTESEIRAYVAECLQPYLDSTGAWDSGVFLATMTELLSYSLVAYDRANHTYSLHVLVHDWASTVIDHPVSVAVDHTALLLSLSIPHSETMEDLAHKRGAEVHVSRVLFQQVEPSANNAALFALVYMRTGDWKQYQRLLQIRVDASCQLLGKDHRDTLNSMRKLACSYRRQGRYNQAVTILEDVLETRKRVPGSDDTLELKVMRTLARVYHNLGRYKQAESLQAVVLDTLERIRGDEHPETMSIMRRNLYN